MRRVHFCFSLSPLLADIFCMCTRYSYTTRFYGGEEGKNNEGYLGLRNGLIGEIRVNATFKVIHRPKDIHLE